MTPRREPAPPSSWKDRIAFREVFLVHAPSGGAATLRQFGRYMYETLMASGLLEARQPRVAASVRDQVRAVAEDLRFSAQVLAALGAGAEEGGLGAEEAALATKLGPWAREIQELVRAIEIAVASPGRPG